MLTRLFALTAAAASFSSVLAQQVGTLTTETHPPLTVATCTKRGGCTNQSLSVTLDANWRWLHQTSGSTNCYTGNTWDATACPDPVTCAKNCALDGADYSGTYGVTTSGTALNLKFVTNGPYSVNIGSRLYLMQNDSTYMMLKLKNKEFTFDVDVSNLGCGLNGALYLSEMLSDGGKSKYSGNAAGAKYGTGYCDSQCPHDIKFINGEANVSGWAPSPNDKNAGTGTYGSCCHEMDIWEANQVSAAYTPHPCSLTGPSRCSGTDCGDGDNRYGGVCDKDGCDFNSYRMGDTSFYGPGKTIDTTKPFTVVTQFITSDGTDTGDLTEIKRLYVQNGVVHDNSQSTIAGVSGNSITTAFCTAQKTVFGDTNSFQQKGGLKAMGDALGRGMVLVLSVWDDHAVNMLWLDSTYPTDKDASTPGVGRGTCATTSGVPSDIEANAPNSSVKYFNIKWGEIGSTYTGTPSSTGGGSGSTTTTVRSTTARPITTTTTQRPITTTTRPITTTTQRPITTTTTRPITTTGGGGNTNCAAKWGQCGGQGYTGPTCCVSGSTCKFSNTWYSQCL